jgi:hypothetical protein
MLHQLRLQEKSRDFVVLFLSYQTPKQLLKLVKHMEFKELWIAKI